jgi:hypothetical protein
MKMLLLSQAAEAAEQVDQDPARKLRQRTPKLQPRLVQLELMVALAATPTVVEQVAVAVVGSVEQQASWIALVAPVSVGHLVAPAVQIL